MKSRALPPATGRLAVGSDADLQDLSRLVVDRQASAFSDDIQDQHRLMRDGLDGHRVLIVGGAGSIGRAVTQRIAMFNCRSLHIIDQNENGLVELTRNLRSRRENISTSDFQSFPIDYGSTITRQFL